MACLMMSMTVSMNPPEQQQLTTVAPTNVSPMSENNDDNDDSDFIDSPRKIMRRNRSRSDSHDFVLELPVNGALLLPHSKNRKRVRFARDAGTNKVVCVHHDDVGVVDADGDDNVAVRWYSQLEFRLFKRNAKREAMAATKAGDQCPYMQHFMKIYGACATANGLRSIRTADSAALSDTPLRGLESVLLNNMKNRKAVIQAVLTKQEDMQLVILNGDASAEDLTTALSLTSRALSQHARRLARVLGSGDAFAARGAAIARLAT
jgi:hypothetical protein